VWHIVYMINEDTLTRLAHANGITDVDQEEREKILADLASQEAEEEDRRLASEFSENEDIDWGYHDQYEQ